MCLTFFLLFICICFLFLIFKINFLISLYRLFSSRFLSIIAWSVVSIKPPLLEMIVAQPLDEASKAVLPKGSSHLDGTTAISDLLNIPKVFLV